MDLEHTNLGKHCEVTDCHQRDFLPFTCDVCSKKLCLTHRTYTAHSCHGADTKDFTSIDCPLCGTSVKFSKSSSPDSVWNSHYLSSCSQQMKVKSHRKCYEATCQRDLGPSNYFTCSKCRQEVCLSHRNPEDHHCQGMRAIAAARVLPTSTNKPPVDNKVDAAYVGITSKRINSSSSLTQTSQTKLPTKPQIVTTPSLTPVTTSSNELATKRSPRTNSIPGPTATSFLCPFCSQQLPDSDSLQSHVISIHPEPTSTTSGDPVNSYSASRDYYASPALNTPQPQLAPSQNSNVHGREVCPVCQARFDDAIQLVMHFETAHNEASAAHSSPSQSQTSCALG